MITCSRINFRGFPGDNGDCAFGNKLFYIASTIGIAIKNGYHYGFPKWNCEDYFVNKLPYFDGNLKVYNMPKTYAGMDFGFAGFNIPDDRDMKGEMGVWKYFEHCQELIRFYFTLKKQCDPFDDCILMHYRDYNNPAWVKLPKGYYQKALRKLPSKRVIVITDNVKSAYKVLGGSYEYTSNTPIVDFFLLCNTKYLIMANSTFSGWAAFLSGAKTIAPSLWYDGILKNAPTKELYLPNWTII